MTNKNNSMSWKFFYGALNIFKRVFFLYLLLYPPLSARAAVVFRRNDKPSENPYALLNQNREITNLIERGKALELKDNFSPNLDDSGSIIKIKKIDVFANKIEERDSNALWSLLENEQNPSEKASSYVALAFKQFMDIMQLEVEGSEKVRQTAATRIPTPQHLEKIHEAEATLQVLLSYLDLNNVHSILGKELLQSACEHLCGKATLILLGHDVVFKYEDVEGWIPKARQKDPNDKRQYVDMPSSVAEALQYHAHLKTLIKNEEWFEALQLINNSSKFPVDKCGPVFQILYAYVFNKNGRWAEADHYLNGAYAYYKQFNDFRFSAFFEFRVGKSYLENELNSQEFKEDPASAALVYFQKSINLLPKNKIFNHYLEIATRVQNNFYDLQVTEQISIEEILNLTPSVYVSDRIHISQINNFPHDNFHYYDDQYKVNLFKIGDINANEIQFCLEKFHDARIKLTHQPTWSEGIELVEEITKTLNESLYRWHYIPVLGQFKSILGKAYFLQGEYNKAIMALKAAIAFSNSRTTDPASYFYLAEALSVVEDEYADLAYYRAYSAYKDYTVNNKQLFITHLDKIYKSLKRVEFSLGIDYQMDQLDIQLLEMCYHLSPEMRGGDREYAIKFCRILQDYVEDEANPAMPNYVRTKSNFWDLSLLEDYHKIFLATTTLHVLGVFYFLIIKFQTEHIKDMKKHNPSIAEPLPSKVSDEDLNTLAKLFSYLLTIEKWRENDEGLILKISMPNQVALDIIPKVPSNDLDLLKPQFKELTVTHSEIWELLAYVFGARAELNPDQETFLIKHEFLKSIIVHSKIIRKELFNSLLKNNVILKSLRKASEESTQEKKKSEQLVKIQNKKNKLSNYIKQVENLIEDIRGVRKGVYFLPNPQFDLNQLGETEATAQECLLAATNFNFTDSLESIVKQLNTLQEICESLKGPVQTIKFKLNNNLIVTQDSDLKIKVAQIDIPMSVCSNQNETPVDAPKEVFVNDTRVGGEKYRKCSQPPKSTQNVKLSKNDFGMIESIQVICAFIEKLQDFTPSSQLGDVWINAEVQSMRLKMIHLAENLNKINLNKDQEFSHELCDLINPDYRKHEIPTLRQCVKKSWSKLVSPATEEDMLFIIKTQKNFKLLANSWCKFLDNPGANNINIGTFDDKFIKEFKGEMKLQSEDLDNLLLYIGKANHDAGIFAKVILENQQTNTNNYYRYHLALLSTLSSMGHLIKVLLKLKPEYTLNSQQVKKINWIVKLIAKSKMPALFETLSISENLVFCQNFSNFINHNIDCIYIDAKLLANITLTLTNRVNKIIQEVRITDKNKNDIFPNGQMPFFSNRGKSEKVMPPVPDSNMLNREKRC